MLSFRIYTILKNNYRFGLRVYVLDIIKMCSILVGTVNKMSKIIKVVLNGLMICLICIFFIKSR